MKWISMKDKQPYSKTEKGYYVVLIALKAHVVYFGYKNWQRPWHIPDEWQEPTHYIKLERVEDIWSNFESEITMD